MAIQNVTPRYSTVAYDGTNGNELLTLLGSPDSDIWQGVTWSVHSATTEQLVLRSTDPEQWGDKVLANGDYLIAQPSNLWVRVVTAAEFAEQWAVIS